MALLHSYSFGKVLGKNELPTEVLELFLELVDNPENEVSCSSEIIYAALSGRIDFNRPFSIDAYEAAIQRNEGYTKSKRRNKERFIDFLCGNEDSDYESQKAKGTVTVDYVQSNAVEKIKDVYEEILLEDELRYAIESIKSIQPVLLSEEKLDIIHTIRQALKGIPESIKNLHRICDSYEVLGEQVQIILSSGHNFEEIFE